MHTQLLKDEEQLKNCPEGLGKLGADDMEWLDKLWEQVEQARLEHRAAKKADPNHVGRVQKQDAMAAKGPVD